MKTTKEVTQALNQIHTDLSQMTPLEPSETDMNDAEHEAWMDQHQRIQGMLKEAHAIVEQALPPEIRRLLHQVVQAGCRLYASTDTIPE
jgi:guanyl-specific ribonuclease Sa